MDNIALSVMKIKRNLAIRRRQVSIWTALALLLASSLALGQTSSISQRSPQILTETKPIPPLGAAQIALPEGYVDGASNCPSRTGNRDCSLFSGPFKKVGQGASTGFSSRTVFTTTGRREAETTVSPDGLLFIRGGVYREPLLLNKRLEIRAYDGTVTIGPSSLAPFDLVADTVDENGLPLNPKWGFQRDPKANREGCGKDNIGSSPCTNQYTYLDYGRLFLFWNCGPHVNWFGATYKGRVFWSGHDRPLPNGDDDYNMRLTMDDKAGYTSRERILCEFDSDETIKYFTTRWWSAFHKAVDQDDDARVGGLPAERARKMMDCGTRDSNSQECAGSDAIVTGLMGLDCEEPECWSELHPVWALAMNVESSIDDDLWVMFVRNWGNEGSCGESQHFIYFPNNQYIFRLPWRPGKTLDRITESFHPYHTQNPPPSVSRGTIKAVPGKGVFVTFTLDAPRESGSMWDGELHLKWR